MSEEGNHGETSLEIARRVQREIAAEDRRHAFLMDQNYGKLVGEEFEKVCNEINRKTDEITRKCPGFKFDSTSPVSPFGVAARLSGHSSGINLELENDPEPKLGKSLSLLHVKVSKAKTHRQNSQKFRFDCDPKGSPCWQDKKEPDSFLNSTDLAEECVKNLLGALRD